MHTKNAGVLHTARIALAMILLCMEVSLPAYAAEKMETTQTVRVGYVDAPNYEEVREDGLKSGFGYEYLQKISYITGWEYEYVFDSFHACYEKLVNGEIDLFGNVTYTPERAELVNFSFYPQGEEEYWIYTDAAHLEYWNGDIQKLNGCKIAVTEGSYQETLLRTWLEEHTISANVCVYNGYDTLHAVLEDGIVDAIVTPALYIQDVFVPYVCIGSSAYYFAVSKDRPDLLRELNMALAKIQQSSFDYNGELRRKYMVPNDMRIRLDAEEQRWLAAHDNTLRIGLLKENPPYSAQDENGEGTGILHVLLEKMSRTLNISIAVQFYPDSQSLKEALMREKIDAIGPVYNDMYLAEQNHYVLTDKLFSTPLTVVYDKENTDMEYGKIAVSGETLLTENAIRLLFPHAATVVCSSLGDCMKAVASGKADFTVVSSICLNLLRQYPVTRSLQFADIPMQIGVSFAATRENYMAAAVLNKGIASTEDEVDSTLLAQYSYVPEHMTWRDFFQAHMYSVMIVTCILMAGFSVLVLLLYRKAEQAKLALQEIQEASDEKGKFLSHMSHEMRTPLHAIINLSKLAQKENNIEIVRAHMEKVLISSDFLLELVNDILDMSKMEAGKLQLTEEPVTRKALFTTVNTIIRPLADAKHIRFHCHYSAGSKALMVDKLRFQQIFLNLLSNAVKCTGENGIIWFVQKDIAVSNDTIAVQFIVRDNGAGISKEFLPHIYEPFEQENPQSSSAAKGTGLGLTIVKDLVEAMHGNIKVRSKLGEGTEFVLDFRVRMAEGVDEPATPKKDAYNLKGMHLLLVEDNEINVYVVQSILDGTGCSIENSENGQEAVNIFRASKMYEINAVLMDVHMPIMDGLEAAKAIRALNRSDAATVPMIAMTADATEAEKENAAQAGMNWYLTKPIDVDQLFSALEECKAQAILDSENLSKDWTEYSIV